MKMAKIIYQKPSDCPNLLQLSGTSRQNKFLLLFTLIYQKQLEFGCKYSAEIERKLHWDEYLDSIKEFNANRIYRELGFKDADECISNLLGSRRFIIFENGQVNIK